MRKKLKEIASIPEQIQSTLADVAMKIEQFLPPEPELEPEPEPEMEVFVIDKQFTIDDENNVIDSDSVNENDVVNEENQVNVCYFIELYLLNSKFCVVCFVGKIGSRFNN